MNQAKKPSESRYGKRVAPGRLRAAAALAARFRRTANIAKARREALLAAETLAVLERITAHDQMTAQRLADGECFKAIAWLDEAVPQELIGAYKSLARSSMFKLPGTWAPADLAMLEAKVDELADRPLEATSPAQPGRPRLVKPVGDAASEHRRRVRHQSAAFQSGAVAPPKGALPISAWRRFEGGGSLWPTVDDRGEITHAQVTLEEGELIARPWWTPTVTEHSEGMAVFVLLGRSDTRWVRTALRFGLANAAADASRKPLLIYIPSRWRAEPSPVTTTLVWDILKKENATVETRVVEAIGQFDAVDNHVVVLDADRAHGGDDHMLFFRASSLVVAGKTRFRNGREKEHWKSSLLRELAAGGHPVMADEAAQWPAVVQARSQPAASIETAMEARPLAAIEPPRRNRWKHVP